MVYIVFVGEDAISEKNYFITDLKIFYVHNFRQITVLILISST